MNFTQGSNILKKDALNNTGRIAGDNQKSYDIPTIKLLNPQLYKEMAKKDRQVRDPIFVSLKNIKERHTYLENR